MVLCIDVIAVQFGSYYFDVNMGVIAQFMVIDSYLAKFCSVVRCHVSVVAAMPVGKVQRLVEHVFRCFVSDVSY